MKKLAAILAFLMAGPALAVDCHISHYSYITIDLGGREVQAAQEPALSSQVVTFTSTSTQSTAFPTGTNLVRIVCTAAAHFLFSADPTALDTGPFLAANTPEYFGLTTSGLKVAFRD